MLPQPVAHQVFADLLPVLKPVDAASCHVDPHLEHSLALHDLDTLDCVDGVALSVDVPVEQVEAGEGWVLVTVVLLFDLTPAHPEEDLPGSATQHSELETEELAVSEMASVGVRVVSPTRQQAQHIAIVQHLELVQVRVVGVSQEFREHDLVFGGDSSLHDPAFLGHSAELLIEPQYQLLLTLELLPLEQHLESELIHLPVVYGFDGDDQRSVVADLHLLVAGQFSEQFPGAVEEDVALVCHLEGVEDLLLKVDELELQAAVGPGHPAVEVGTADGEGLLSVMGRFTLLHWGGQCELIIKGGRLCT